MAKCNHIWKEKIYDCCEACGQRHNQEHCSACDIAKIAIDPPCLPKTNIADEKLLKQHYIHFIQTCFAYTPNPIDAEEEKTMRKKLSQYQGEFHLMNTPVKNWGEFIRREMNKDYFKTLNKFLMEEEKAGHTIYPAKENIFKAFELCWLENVRCVILGQDPYINDGEAMGLSFSVPDGIKVPPSLRNIFTEIKNDLKKPNYEFKNGDLTEWARQGVLLLNSALTVRANTAGSHSKVGWNNFTNAAISLIDSREKPIVYLLWGSHAKSKASLVKNKKSLLLQSSHPSPLAANQGGWFGNHHFSTANEFLIRNNDKPIRWLI